MFVSEWFLLWRMLVFRICIFCMCAVCMYVWDGMGRMDRYNVSMGGYPRFGYYSDVGIIIVIEGHVC